MMITVVKPQSLTSRQQYLGTIAALEALGDMERLNSALKNALDGELTINEIKEVFLIYMLIQAFRVRLML